MYDYLALEKMEDKKKPTQNHIKKTYYISVFDPNFGFQKKNKNKNLCQKIKTLIFHSLPFLRERGKSSNIF